MTILYDYCESSLMRLNASFESTKAMSHRVSMGGIREQLIRDFLVDHLPSVCRIVSGQIFDAQDQRSTQQDVVITLTNVPRMPFASGVDLIFAEGVISTIEVKSNLSARELKQISGGISSVRALKPNSFSHAFIGLGHAWPGDRILSGVLTYKASSLSSLVQVLETLDGSAQPDFVLDLSAGMIVKNEGLLLPKPHGENFIIINNAPQAFMLFLTFLTEITSSLAGRGVDWRKYWT